VCLKLFYDDLIPKDFLGGNHLYNLKKCEYPN